MGNCRIGKSEKIDHKNIDANKTHYSNPKKMTVNEKYTHSPPVSLSQQTLPYPLNSQSNSPYRNGGYSLGMSSTQQNEYQKFPHHGPESYFDKSSQDL